MSDKHSIKTEWKGGMAFEADVNGYKVQMNAPEEGPSPKRLQLAALSGCTGMDIVSLLQKMRVKFDAVNIEVQGEVADTDPKMYTRMHVIYEITGTDIPLEKVQKAVRMSEETYCGVGALYRKAIEVTSEIKIIEP